jgi:hypothetical protein
MKIIICLLFFTLLAQSAAAENISLAVTLPGEIYLGAIHTSLFKITNLNHVKGVDSFVNVTISYNVKRADGSEYYASNFSKLVNSYSSSSTGYLFAGELGNFVLCGCEACNDLDCVCACGNFSVLNPMALGCNASINITVEKEIYYNNEKVGIRNLLASSDDLPFVIEYWVEDLFGNEVKGRMNTSNLDEKTFTPDISEKDGVFIAKNMLVFIGCNNSNPAQESSRLFVVKNQDYSPDTAIRVPAGSADEVSETATKNVSKSKGSIASFYTRTKKYHEEINLYANIKVDSRATVVLRGSLGDQYRELAGSEKLVFSAKASPGENVYILELYKSDELIDSKSLLVSLEGSAAVKVEPKNTTAQIIKNATKSSSTTGQQLNKQTPKTDGEQTLNSSKEFYFEIAQPSNTVSANSLPEPSPMTGLVTYRSSKDKVAGYAPYFVIGMLLLVIAVYSLKKRR